LETANRETQKSRRGRQGEREREWEYRRAIDYRRGIALLLLQTTALRSVAKRTPHRSTVDAIADKQTNAGKNPD